VEFSITAVAMKICQLQTLISQCAGRKHAYIKPGVGWRQRGFTVSDQRSKTKLLKEDIVVSLLNPTDVSYSSPK